MQDPTQTETDQDKQVTVAVPEDRLAEFYAFFGRFLAVGGPGGRRGRHGHADARRGPGHGGHRCGGHRAADREATATETAGSAQDAESQA